MYRIRCNCNTSNRTNWPTELTLMILLTSWLSHCNNYCVGTVLLNVLETYTVELNFAHKSEDGQFQIFLLLKRYKSSKLKLKRRYAGVRRCSSEWPAYRKRVSTGNWAIVVRLPGPPLIEDASAATCPSPWPPPSTTQRTDTTTHVRIQESCHWHHQPVLLQLFFFRC